MADANPEKEFGICRHCRKQTTSRCIGCLNAPVYDEFVYKATFYCSPKCQKEDWKQHKAECKKLQTRKKLRRAAEILRLILYKIRQHASPFEFKSLRVEGSDIFLDGYQIMGVLESKRGLIPLPIAMGDNQGAVEAVLSYTACTEALMYLYRFAERLFAELCSKVEEVNVNAINPKLQIIPVALNAIRVAIPESHQLHNVYRVTLYNGEIWVVDATGAQYGFSEALYRWRDFEGSRMSKVNRVYKFGHIHDQGYQRNNYMPFKSSVTQMMEKQELSAALDRAVPKLAQAQGGKLDRILAGSDEAFKKNKDKFLHEFEGQLQLSLKYIYSPDEVTRRSQESDIQLAKNQSDPERQKMFDGFLKFQNSRKES